MTYTEYVDANKAKLLEKETIEIYDNMGFNILNTAKAGAIGGGNLKWTFEKCKEEALKCKTRTEFYKINNSAYNSSRNNGWLNEVCAHMKSKTKK